MFTLNDLLDQVECLGEVRVLMIEKGSGGSKGSLSWERFKRNSI